MVYKGTILQEEGFYVVLVWCTITYNIDKDRHLVTENSGIGYDCSGWYNTI